MSTAPPAAEKAASYMSADDTPPVQSRSEFFQSADVADFASVTGREAQWKHSPVARLAPLLDGDLDGSAYPLTVSDSPNVNVHFVPSGEVTRGIAGLPEERLSANAWGQVEDVLLIELTGDSDAPVVVTREGLGESARAAHTLVSVAPGAHATIVVRSRGVALLGETVEFDLGQDSSLHAVFLGEWSAGAIQYATHSASLGKGAVLTHIAVDLGGDIVVVNPNAHLIGERSQAHLLGAYFAEATQHHEHRVYVNHVGAQTVSRVNYKGALHGRGARTVWVGDVLIGPDAVGTDSYEQNRNLVLSEGTRADSIPNLEIKTGDIQGAGHASATGRFDDEQLFYLQSRGIEELEARRLVVLGFLLEVLQKIPVPELVTELTEAMQVKLTKTEDTV